MDGFAGIPQETRLLFRGLRLLEEVRLEGLIQHPVRRLARGARPKGKEAVSDVTGAPIESLLPRNRFAGGGPFKTLFDKIADLTQKAIANAELCLTTLLRIRTVRLPTSMQPISLTSSGARFSPRRCLPPTSEPL